LADLCKISVNSYIFHGEELIKALNSFKFCQVWIRSGSKLHCNARTRGFRIRSTGVDSGRSKRFSQEPQQYQESIFLIGTRSVAEQKQEWFFITVVLRY